MPALELPWLIAAGLALVAAIAFGAGLGVPKERPSGVHGFVLRWGHALTWLLLAITFVAVAAGYGSMAGYIGLLALASYVAFIVALSRAKKRST